MSIPVEAATVLFSPQPLHATVHRERQHSSLLDKNQYLEFFKRYDTPSIIGEFLRGWSSPSPRRESADSDSSAASFMERPSHPPPESEGYHTPMGIPMDGEESRRRGRCDSVQVGHHINELLSHDEVKEALSALEQALQTMNITDVDPERDVSEVAQTYSSMIEKLCEPKMANLINQISGCPKDAIEQSIMWRMFTKVIESGYTLEHNAYTSIIHFLMDHKNNDLALQALYAMPRTSWDFEIYKLAVMLHLMQSPKQMQQAELLVTEFGKPFLEVANPIAPTELPPLRIKMPLMENVTDQDRFKLWMVYQTALSDTAWGRAKEEYERKRRRQQQQTQSRKRMSNTAGALVDWAMRRMSIETEEERIERERVDWDNAMIYRALSNKQYEYGWNIYLRMGEAVNEFTPRVVMHLCRRAFSDTPMMTHVSRRAEWEGRAWEVYGRFMCSEYLHPEEPEMPGFLSDLLSITAFSPEKRERVRYTKTLSVYDLLQRLSLNSLLGEDQVVVPVLCMLLFECRGAPATIIQMCNKAFEIFHTQRQFKAANAQLSVYWALFVLCVKSGDVLDFSKVLKCLTQDGEGEEWPTSLLAPIQTFHDRYLDCGQRTNVHHCYFHDYIFQRVKHTDEEDDDDDDDRDQITMDAFGFIELVSNESGEFVQRERGDLAEPVAFVDHAVHRRTNIPEPLAALVARAAAIGAAKDEQLQQRKVYYTPNKARSLLRHCLDIVSKKDV